MMITHRKSYAEITSIENLFQAWGEFKKGKRNRKDVQIFERNLEDNLFELQQALKDKTYRHGQYHSFYVYDPKLRHIHKAQVKDRIIHHLLYKYLYELYDQTFIHDSYSCRLEKGTHKGVKRLEGFTRIVSKNYSRDCWALKCDIKKFFASVDQKILLKFLKRKVKDEDILWLLQQVINSFHSDYGVGKGIPLGNLTSQVFANIYLNELDQFVKHKLKVKYYLRYADDFLMLSWKSELLKQLIVPLGNLLKRQLKLELQSKKIVFRKFSWGIDFLGYIVLPHYILPRTKTRRRIFKKLKNRLCSNDLYNFNQSLQSYLGYLSHAHSHKVAWQLKTSYPGDIDGCVNIKSMVKLIDFWAPWCGPCKIMNPVIEELEKDLNGQVQFEKVNVDDEPQKASEFGVMGIPTFVIVDDKGKEITRKVGVTSKEELHKLLTS